MYHHCFHFEIVFKLLWKIVRSNWKTNSTFTDTLLLLFLIFKKEEHFITILIRYDRTNYGVRF